MIHILHKGGKVPHFILSLCMPRVQYTVIASGTELLHLWDSCWAVLFYLLPKVKFCFAFFSEHEINYTGRAKNYKTFFILLCFHFCPWSILLFLHIVPLIFFMSSFPLFVTLIFSANLNIWKCICVISGSLIYLVVWPLLVLLMSQLWFFFTVETCNMTDSKEKDWIPLWL